MTKRETILNIFRYSLGSKYVFNSSEPEEYKPIGQGGSGIVYLADQIFSQTANIFVKRAIKFFMFRDDLIEKFGYVSKDNFDTEIKNITRFNHQNILKVIDGDYYSVIVNNQEVRIPYTITEFIDGPNLQELFDPNFDNNNLCKKSLKMKNLFSSFFLKF